MRISHSVMSSASADTRARDGVVAVLQQMGVVLTVVPQPDALTRMASRPSPSISAIQARTLALANSRACLRLPMCRFNEPQQAAEAGTTTSQPRRVSRRIVASLMCGESTGCTQPASKATRHFRSPRAG